MIVPGLLLVLTLGVFFWDRAANTLPASLPPPHPMPAVNARDYYIAATNALVNRNKIGEAVMSRPAPAQPIQKGPSPRPFSGKLSPPPHLYSPGEKAKLVAENSQAVSLLHQGFRYPYQELPIASFNTPTPQYAKFRQLARLMFLSAQVKAAQGDWNGAVNADLDAVQLGETVPRGGGLIGMLVGAACQSIGRKHIWEAVPLLSATEARAAARGLEAIRASHVPLAETMQEEKWDVQASLRQAMQQRSWPQRLIPPDDPSTPIDEGDEEPLSRPMVVWIKLEGKRKIMANYTGYMDQVIAQAHQPYAKHPTPPPLPYDPVCQLLLPATFKVRLNEVRSVSQNALLVTALALQAYHQDHKAYPPSLTALVPGYLKAVPTDPFALSGPLRYKLVGAKYVLYSVGPDGKDDGGKAIFDATKPAPSSGDTSDRRRWTLDDSTGDVVAGVNVI